MGVGSSFLVPDIFQRSKLKHNVPRVISMPSEELHVLLLSIKTPQDTSLTFDYVQWYTHKSWRLRSQQRCVFYAFCTFTRYYSQDSPAAVGFFNGSFYAGPGESKEVNSCLKKWDW